MANRADFLVNSRSPRYLHGFQKDTNETTELPHTVPVDNQVTYIDSFTNYGVDTVYGHEYVLAASDGNDPRIQDALNLATHVELTAKKYHGIYWDNDTSTYETSIAYNVSTRTFTITPTNGSFRIYLDGVLKVFYGPQSITHAATEGGWFFYFNSSGVLTASQAAWSLLNDVPLAFLYYDASTPEGLLLEGRHHHEADKEWHNSQHFAMGTFVKRGTDFILGGYTIGVSSNAAVTWDLGAGTVVDEDINTAVAAVVDGGPYQTWYKLGASGAWRRVQRTVPYHFNAGTNWIQYNQLTGGSWQLTDLANNQFANIYIFAVPATDTSKQILIVPSQRVYATETLADSEGLSDLDLTGFPSQEFVGVWKLVMRADTGGGATGRAQIRKVTRLVGARTASFAGGTAPTVHNSLSGRADADTHPASSISNTPAGNIAATTVQAAINELDSEKGGLAQGNTWVGSNTFTQSLTALQFVKSGGTSGQFLKADGSVDSSSYETTITAGTTSQYYRGDKTWQALDTVAVTESTNLYFTNARVLGTVLTGLDTTLPGAVAASDTILAALGKLENRVAGFTASGVSSFNTRTGAVTLTSGDVTGALGFSPSPDTHTHPASSITNTPAGNIAATTVQAAINELDSEKVTANVAIAGSTKTKITYDSKGLVTSGSDATATDIVNTPAGNISATTVQAAINELDSEKAQLAGTLTDQRVPFADASGFLTDNANFYYVSGTGLRVLDTTTSTAPNNGAFVVGGSIGVGNGVYAEGNITARGGTIRCGNPTFAGSATVGLDSASGRVRQFIIYSADIARWSFRVDSSAETGTEAGSNLTIRAFTDAGGLVDDPITIVRAAGGNLTSPRPIRFTNSTASTSTTTGALVVSGGIGCGGYFTGKYRSSDGTAGLTATRTFYAASSSGGATNVLNTVTIKDGIITSWTQA